MIEDHEVFYLQKVGASLREIYWIGDCIDEGKEEAKLHADKDEDDYHEWQLCKYVYDKPGVVFYVTRKMP